MRNGLISLFYALLIFSAAVGIAWVTSDMLLVVLVFSATLTMLLAAAFYAGVALRGSR